MKPVSPKKLQRLYAEYVKDGNFGDVAARHGLHKKRLGNLFRAAGLPILNNKSKPRAKPPTKAQVRRWHREYAAGTSLKKLADKYAHTSGFFAPLFRAHGLKVNAPGWNGDEWPLQTEAEVAQLIEAVAARGVRGFAHTIKVPDEIRSEWKRWSLERRGDFIRRLRARMALPNDAPTTPFSANVEPFDYGSPRAWEIANAANQGLPSRYWKMRIFPSCQGVIWRGQLWFWIRDSGGRNRGCYQGAFINHGDSKNRPQLHREIYAAEVGPIPRGHVVRFRDNNFNNLDPANLYTQSRADEASENSVRRRARNSRQLTALLLQRHERKQNHEHANDELVRQVGARSPAPGRSARRGLSATTGA